MRTLLCMIVGLMTNQLLNAQDEIGFKVGGNINSATINGLTASLTPEVNTYTGFSGGVYYSTPLSKNVHFRPEVNYTQKGFSIDASSSVDLFGIDLPIGVEAVTKINTINLQLPISYSFINNDKVEMYAYAGPTLGYATNAFVQTKANFIFDFNIMKIDINMNDNSNQRFEAGALAGLGLGIKTSRGKILFETEFQHGLNATLKTPIVNVGATNKGFGFSVGYAINI